MELTATYDRTYSELNDPESIPEGVRVDVKITVPQMKGVSVGEQGLELNAYFQAEGNGLLWKAAEYMGTPGLAENDTVTVEWTYKVTRNDGQWLSVRRQGVIYVSGSAYPTTVLHSDTFRVADGALQQVLLEEAFDLTPEEAQAHLVDQLEVLGEGAYDRANLNASFDFQRFYLTEDSLVLYYQEGQLGSHALGTPEFHIPLVELSKLLKKGALPS
jgi:hypothetical protein